MIPGVGWGLGAGLAAFNLIGGLTGKKTIAATGKDWQSRQAQSSVAGVMVEQWKILQTLNLEKVLTADGTQVLEEELIDLLQKLMIGKIPCGIGLEGMI